jgi:hypothetical protein
MLQQQVAVEPEEAHAIQAGDVAKLILDLSSVERARVDSEKQIERLKGTR